ncbi:hypothetical protein BDU57DRAFT_514163 [Ampelomyces quisqualis]|uniref:WKF domain-containing protein n=1 Tax=Ampelomyces quisqualis TaxID=50730 RepID=A0A6A5QT10_AMPQU|nr:hypothetical protein BDU57DRAFT_514163 [Ampelomyces quisqualis]
MADAASRIPAWKRLGLALKNEAAQSGVTTPEINTSHSNLQHHSSSYGRDGSQTDVHISTEPALNGKSSKLGKRKHPHDTAEENEQTAKKGKPSTVESHTNDSVAIDNRIIADIAAAEAQRVVPQVSLNRSQPKGDPNYRKKKSKPSKSKRRVLEKTLVDPGPIQDKVHHDRSALSPDATVPAKGRNSLVSTGVQEQALAPDTTPQRHRGTRKDSKKGTLGSPSAVDRRKSVTFTPDTKRVDGSSGQDLFKNWVAEQKGVYLDFSGNYSEPVDKPEVQDAPKPVAKPEKEQPAEKPIAIKSTSARNSFSAKKTKPTSTVDIGSTATGVKSKGKRKDPTIYVSYLTQYHSDRAHWKFNKAKQNDVVDNALNIFRIPDEFSEAMLEYVQGLKGAGVIQRLRGKCEHVLKELDEEDAMDNPSTRKAMHDEALQTRIAKERKRRKVEGDVEGLAGHPHGDGYIRRMRRERAEALLTALGRAAPILPATHTNGINPMLSNVAPVRDSRKRKRRGDISSDDSSSESSSEEENSEAKNNSDSDSESDSDTDSNSSDPDARTQGSSESGSGSDSTSGSDGSARSESDSD